MEKEQDQQIQKEDTSIPIPTVWRALDNLQLCYTVIPQMKHYYRYGAFRDCSAARKELMFAFSLKTKGRKEAERLVLERETDKYIKKMVERSSKAVWELRTEPPENFPPNITETAQSPLNV